MQLLRVGAILAAIWFCASAVTAQTGGLEVRVFDIDGQSPLPGATVMLSNTQGLIAPTAELSSTEGLVRFPVLRSGRGYVVEVSFVGFATQRVPDIRISSGETERVAVRLAPEMQESVQVRANLSVVELDKTGNSSKFSDEFMENLPVPGRFYQNVLTLAPGVQDADRDGNPNVHGARQREFRAEVSGVSNTDPLTGEWLSFVNTESIEELEIITSGAGVEFGRASGGFARILQKQGTNEFEGVFTYFYRSSELDGDGAADYLQETSPEFSWHQPGILVSGPIVKDRLWYRLSHEYLRREDPIVLTDRIDLVTRTQITHADQLTWQVSPRNKLAFQFQSDPVTVENLGLSSRVPADSSQRLERGGPTYSLSWVAPHSPRLLFDTTVAYQDSERKTSPMNADAPQDCVTFVVSGSRGYDSLNRTRCFDLTTSRTSGGFPTTVRDERQRLTVASQLTYFANRFLGTSHRVKFGVIVENERYYRELERNPDMTMFLERFGLDTVGSIDVEVSAPTTSSGRATGSNWGIYVEDQLQPTAGLAITLGLRLDHEEIDSAGQSFFEPSAESREFIEKLESGTLPSFAASGTFTAFPNASVYQHQVGEALEVGYPIPLAPTAADSAFWVNTRRAEDIQLELNNFAPRLALAWDPWKNGKTKFFVSAGRYYDKIVLAVPLMEIEPPRSTMPFTSQTTGAGQFTFQQDRGLTVSAQMVDRDLRTPYQDEFAIGFERALWDETSLKLTYLRRQFRDQLQDVDINHEVGDHGYCVVGRNLGDPAVVASPGVGEILKDPYSGETYVDTDPGNGDGYIRPGSDSVLDDCTGDVGLEGGPFNGRYFEQPDGLPDLYVQNPGWGEMLLVGNFNESNYEAFIFEIVRRFYRSWELNFSYTWSQAVGDAEDFNQVLGNERSLKSDETGFLAYDQRHVAQLSWMSLLRWGLRLGGRIRWETGLPFSELQSKETVFARPPEYENFGDLDQQFRLRYPTGTRNDQRNQAFWNVDVRLAKEFRLSKSAQVQLTAEIFNLLGDDTLILDDRINGLVSGEKRFGRQFQLGIRVGF